MSAQTTKTIREQHGVYEYAHIIEVVYWRTSTLDSWYEKQPKLIPEWTNRELDASHDYVERSVVEERRLERVNVGKNVVRPQGL